MPDEEDPDCYFLYALQRLDSPELRPKPEQRSTIESVYREKDVFVWYLCEIIDLSPDISSRYMILSIHLRTIPIVLNNAMLFFSPSTSPAQMASIYRRHHDTRTQISTLVELRVSNRRQ